MKSRTILLLTLSLVILGTVYYFDYRALVRRETAQVERGRVCLLEPGEIDRIMIHNRAGDFELEKRGAEWWIAKPRELRADAKTVTGRLLDALSQANKFSPFEARQSSLGEYGLDAASAVVEVQIAASGSKRPPLRIRLGKSTPIQGECYMLDTAEPSAVFVASSALRDAFDLSLLGLRDKAIFPFPAQRVGAMRIETVHVEPPQNAAQTTTTLAVPSLIARRGSDGSWWIGDQDSGQPGTVGPAGGLLRGDDRDIDRLLAAFLAMEPVDTATSPGLALPPAYEREIVRVALEYAVPPDADHATTTTARTTVAIGATLDGQTPVLHAVAQGNDLVYKAERALVSRLLGPLSSFRDRQVLRISPPDAAYMQIQVKNSAFSLERGEDGRWRFADEPGAAVNQLKANAYLSVCLGLRVDTFDLGENASIDAKKAGLEPPVFSFMVRSRDGSVRERFEIGSRCKTDESKIYGRRIRPDEKGTPPIFLLALPESYDLALHKTRRFFTVRPLLAFDSQSLDRIQLVLNPSEENPSTMTIARRISGGETTWQGSIGDAPAKEVPAPLADLLLSVLGEMEFQVELEPKSASLGIVKLYGLDRPYLTLRILDSAGKELASLELGRLSSELSDKQASLPDSERSVLVRTNGQVYRYVIMNQLNALDKALTAVASRVQ